MDQMINGRNTSMGSGAWGMTVPMGPGGRADMDPGGWNGQTGERPAQNNRQGMNSMGGMGNGSMNGMWGNMPANSPNAPMHTSPPGNPGMQMMDLSTGLSAETIDNPVTLEEARLGSLRSLLQKLIGHYIVASFLIGTEEAVSWEGFLYSVGNDYIVIFQPDIGRYVTGDMYSLKFVEFYNEKGTVPPCIGSRRRDANGRW